MKIAKKVLAVVMALAMIAGLSAMAFAAGGTYKLTSTTEGEYLVVSVTLKNGAGVEADKLTVVYDPAVLKINEPVMDVTDGKDAVDVKNNVANNSYLGQATVKDDGTLLKEGEVAYGYVFTQVLTKEFLTPNRGATVNADPDNFELVKIYFTVLDEDVSTEIKVTSNEAGFKGSSLIVGEPVVKDEPKEDDKADEGTPVDPTPVETEPTTEEPSEEPNPDNGDKPTGDNMALAAAAGVALLAGAAFIVSKKRK